MNKTKKIIIGFGSALTSALTAVSALAQTSVTAPTVPTTVTTFTKTNLFTQIGVLVNWVVALVGIAALVFLMYGAYLYMSSGSNEDNLKKAKTSVIYGIVGAIIAILAFAIFSFAASLVA